MDAPAKPKSYVTYTAEAQTVPAGKHAVLQLRFQLMPGFHVNSHTPKSDTLIPTALTLQPAAGVKAGEPAVSARTALQLQLRPQRRRSTSTPAPSPSSCPSWPPPASIQWMAR